MTEGRTVGSTVSRSEKRQTGGHAGKHGGRVSAPRRRPGLRGLLACLGAFALGLSLGAGSGVAWSAFGTDVVASKAKTRAVTQFRAKAHDVVERTAQLHTDLAEAQPPAADLRTSPWGMLYVPSWAADGEALADGIPIKEGTTDGVLDSGAAGHEVGAAAPGEIGNFVLAAHRRTYGSGFLRLPDLRAGDTLVVETTTAWFVYEVTGSEAVAATRGDVLAPVPGHPDAQPTQRLVTLYTGHSLTLGSWGNDHRWVVTGTLVGWAEHDAGVPEALLGH
ncbi:class E sortase [Xylanimonas allomyrinae]|uniref:Class E sortase n=1 Tax=Xylanimonas allomyrinae TaxID=2509459 RepID=A0A4P6F0D4_9MICO|nr:sortase [Xylanimonas allomyrinae]QAY63788.1 class E sortase [Xylanimonas allomyrinae]